MIIVPDIHGRNFWRKAVEEHPDEKVVFLGDYVDPYPYEELDALDGMEQLYRAYELKEKEPERVTLLLGNHDLAYIFPRFITANRHSDFYADTLMQMFRLHRECFQMASFQTIAGKLYLFSHAGIHPRWVEAHPELFTGLHSYEDIVVQTNRFLKEEVRNFLTALSDISFRRGGNKEYGSMIWADNREYWDAVIPDSIYQIFGHTQQQEYPLIEPHYACLDCSMAFRLNETDGTLRAIEQAAEAEKVIFLDFDGVMHAVYFDAVKMQFRYTPYDDYGPMFDKECIENLRQILFETDAKIVVSSSWKECMGLRQIQEMWMVRGLPGEVIGTTPQTGGDRGDEIEEWLRLHPTSRKYVILDDMDETHFTRDQASHFVRVYPDKGLSRDNAGKAKEILGKKAIFNGNPLEE